VAKAAMESGVASRPIEDFDAYRSNLEQFVYRSGNFMKPIFAAARRAATKRVVYAEGEDERVLRAAQVVIDEGIAQPILVGRPAVIESRIQKLGLRIKPGVDFEVVNPERDDRYRVYWQAYHRLTNRKGVTEQYAQIELRRRFTLIGALMVHLGEADGMICGTFGSYTSHLGYIDQVIGKRQGVCSYGAMNTVLLPGRQLTIVDTHVNHDPSAEQIAELTTLAAEQLAQKGVQPKAALLSHSNFGTSNLPTASKMREALAILHGHGVDFEVDGEMHADAALDPAYRATILPDSCLTGEANLLVMPTMDAANVAYNLLKVAAGNNVAIGPVLLGAAAPVHILTPSATVRRIVNMTAWTVSDIHAQNQREASLLLSPAG
jgi:malate dehydrogenase (oxaloacetate-decarboxylating)(NADP+)